jgi:glutaredoxin
MEIVQISGMMTVPQIYVGEVARENLIWGYSELTELQAEWKLEERLG